MARKKSSSSGRKGKAAKASAKSRGGGRSSGGRAGSASKRSTSKRSTSKRGSSKRGTSKRGTSAPRAVGRSSVERATKASGRATRSTAKVGDDREAARRFAGGGGDFGAAESNVRERNYVSSETRMQDPGGAPGHARGEGVRDEGVGGNDSGPGASSGGDVDTDVIGVGTGGSSIAASGTIHRPPGPDDNDGTSNEYAAPGPKGHADTKLKGKIGGSKRVRGSTVLSTGDADTLHEGRGSASVTNPARNDDSFASEISNDEASGADNSFSDDQP